ncbi:MAG: hypothetical protein AAF638_00545 [Pseudomonadota bacterium]
MDGATRTPSGLSRDASDQFIGIGDFDDNGVDDVLFARGSNGAKVAFNVDGSFLTGFGRTSQDVVAIGDFDGDGADDVLFEAPASDAFIEVDGASAGVIATFVNPGTVRAVGDYDADFEKKLVFEEADGSFELIAANGTPLVDYGQAVNTLIALDPLGTGSLGEDILVI